MRRLLLDQGHHILHVLVIHFNELGGNKKKLLRFILRRKTADHPGLKENMFNLRCIWKTHCKFRFHLKRSIKMEGDPMNRQVVDIGPGKLFAVVDANSALNMNTRISSVVLRNQWNYPLS